MNLQEQYERQFIGRNLTEILFKKFKELKGKVINKLDASESELFSKFDRLKRRIHG